MSKNNSIAPVFASPFALLGLSDPFRAFDEGTLFTPRAIADGFPALKVDVRETDDSYIVEADFPGASKDDITLTVEDGALTIAYEKAEESETPEDSEPGKYLVRERKSSFVSVKRTIELGDIDEDGTKANFADGVLTVTAAKKEPVETKKVVAID